MLKVLNNKEATINWHVIKFNYKLSEKREKKKIKELKCFLAYCCTSSMETAKSEVLSGHSEQANDCKVFLATGKVKHLLLGNCLFASSS